MRNQTLSFITGKKMIDVKRRCDLAKSNGGIKDFRFHDLRHNFAIMYTGLGDKARAFEWLTECVEEHTLILFHLKSRPFFDSLRSDPRLPRIAPPHEPGAVNQTAAECSDLTTTTGLRTMALYRPTCV